MKGTWVYTPPAVASRVQWHMETKKVKTKTHYGDRLYWIEMRIAKPLNLDTKSSIQAAI